MTMQERAYKLVKHRCKTTGTKQKYWAAQCGFSEKDFSLLLNGHRKFMDKDIEKVCIGMKVSPNELFNYGEKSA